MWKEYRKAVNYAKKLQVTEKEKQHGATIESIVDKGAALFLLSDDEKYALHYELLAY